MNNINPAITKSLNFQLKYEWMTCASLPIADDIPFVMINISRITTNINTPININKTSLK